MKKYNFICALTVLLVSSLIWSSNSFAALGSQPMVNVEGLTLDEAKNKYGIESENNHPMIFEVNAESGVQNCELIAASKCSQACSTAKIFYQSSKLIPNYNGTSTMKVDVYYDINEVSIGTSNKCNV
jgi:hypothetical protein